MSRFDERGEDAERRGFIEHTLNQSLHSVLCSAKRSQAWHTQRSRCAAKDKIPPADFAPPIVTTALAKVRQRQLNDVEGAPEVRLELVPDLIFVLIFTRTDHAVAGAIGYDVNAAPVGEGYLVDGGDRFANTDVAEQGEIWGLVVGAVSVSLAGGGRRRVEVLHAGEIIMKAAADGGDKVGVSEGGFDDRAAHVACSPEDLIGMAQSEPDGRW